MILVTKDHHIKIAHRRKASHSCLQVNLKPRHELTSSSCAAKGRRVNHCRGGICDVHQNLAIGAVYKCLGERGGVELDSNAASHHLMLRLLGLGFGWKRREEEKRGRDRERKRQREEEKRGREKEQLALSLSKSQRTSCNINTIRHKTNTKHKHNDCAYCADTLT
jgi:hypothetical protein